MARLCWNLPLAGGDQAGYANAPCVAGLNDCIRMPRTFSVDPLLSLSGESGRRSELRSRYAASKWLAKATKSGSSNFLPTMSDAISQANFCHICR
jgi:hypothetical protein